VAWKENKVPISITETEMYRHAVSEGQAKILTSLLKVRFGDDPAIDEIVARLAEVDPEEAVRMVCEATTIDALRE